MVKKIILGVLLAFTVLVVGYAIWSENAPQAGEAAQAALLPSDDVQIEARKGVVLSPQNAKNTGLIFYSGARVRPESYAPVLRAIADAGYPVFAPKMPFNTAIIATRKAEGIIEEHPEVERWVIAGHSLGGTAAAVFLDGHRDEIDGIIFWASYPANGDDLSEYAGVVASVSAELDGLATPEKVDAAKVLLPEGASYVQIAGGNHAQFGDYGAQKGDNAAKISPEDQWQQVLDASLEALGEVEAK